MVVGSQVAPMQIVFSMSRVGPHSRLIYGDGASQSEYCNLI